ncbi:TPA: DUF1310 family protein [Streptococcus suis]
MKKVMKIIIGILLVIGIGIGGIGYMQHKEHEKMVAIATSEEAKKVYEEYLKKLDSKALTAQGKIRTYEIDENDLEYNPMGGMMVRLYINDDTNMDVQIGIVKRQNNELEVFGATSSSEFGELLEGGD